jgi:D-alanine-D-alanine ligase
MPKLNVGIVFGGMSPEHEISVITSLQIAAVLDRDLYEVTPVYLSKSGRWYTGDGLLKIEAYSDVRSLLKRARPVTIIPGAPRRLRLESIGRGPGRLFSRRQQEIDVMFLGLHGGAGENGGIQGLCEAMDVAFTGSGVLASSLAMDKYRSKEFCRNRGIPVLDAMVIRESEWADREDEVMNRVTEGYPFPIVVKPVSLGSSIGISRVTDRDGLDAAIEEALRYDEAVLIERAVEHLREINCSVLGDEDSARASVLEEPVSGDELLTYADKYRRGVSSGDADKSGRSISADPVGKAGTAGMASLNRRIPALVPDELRDRIQEMSVRIFQMLGCAGVARIDYLMNGDNGDIFFNEINTIPGSMSFYLWEPSGVGFAELVEEMISIAMRRYDARSNRVRTYDVNLLAERAVGGLKGSKSG